MIIYAISKSLRLGIVGCVGAVLSACVQLDPTYPETGQWAPYEDHFDHKHEVEIDLGRDGVPSRPYHIISRATIETEDGPGGDRYLNSKIAHEVRRANGHAAVRLHESKRTEVENTNHRIYVKHIRVIEIAVIRYE
jgi:hypothetical protein